MFRDGGLGNIRRVLWHSGIGCRDRPLLIGQSSARTLSEQASGGNVWNAWSCVGLLVRRAARAESQNSEPLDVARHPEPPRNAVDPKTSVTVCKLLNPDPKFYSQSPLKFKE